MADVAEFTCSWEQPRDDWSYSETHAFYVARLADGTWGLLEEDADTTGHGCQCGSSATRHETVADLLRFGVPEHETEARAVIAAACGAVLACRLCGAGRQPYPAAGQGRLGIAVHSLEGRVAAGVRPILASARWPRPAALRGRVDP
jgi:hypothetical protein